jgi:hypothetical protein
VSVHSRLGRTGLGHQANGKDARDAEEERRKASELLIFVQNEIRYVIVNVGANLRRPILSRLFLCDFCLQVLLLSPGRKCSPWL